MKILKKYRYLFVVISIILFVIILFEVKTKGVLTLDNTCYSFISNHLIRDSITPIAKFFTFWGSTFTIIVLAVIFLIVLKKKQDKIYFALNLIIITILNQGIKFIVQRPRPNVNRIITETGYSFPSGHSMVSFAFYGLLIYFAYKYINNKYLKWTIIIILCLLIPLIAISRVYLGVHYTSDCLAGHLLSLAHLIIFIDVMNRRKINEK